MADKSIRITIATALNSAGFKSASSGLASLQEKVKNAFSSMKSSMKSIGSNLMNIKAGFDMVSGAAMKLYDAYKYVTQKAFDAESMLTSFKTLTGAIEIAKNHVADLKRFASETPLTIGDLSQASKTLLAYGASINTVIPSLKLLGDISLGNSEKFQSLVMAFGKVQSQGRMTGIELKQMVLAGFNPLVEISKETGVSMVDLKKALEAGEISFGLVEAAMKKATSEGGRFNNALKDASKTGNGLMSTLSDNWTMAVSEFGSAFASARKEGVEKMISTLQELRQDGSISSWAKNSKRAIDSVSDAFSWAINDIKKGYRALGISDIVATARGLVASVGAYGTRYVAGLVNGEGDVAAENNANTEGGSQFAKNATRGYWIGKLAKSGWLGKSMKEAYEDNVSDDEFEKRQKENAKKRYAEELRLAEENAKKKNDINNKHKSGTIKDEWEKAQAEKTAKFEKARQDAIDETMAKLRELAGMDADVNVSVKVEEPKPVDVKVNEPKPVDVVVKKPNAVKIDVENPAPVTVEAKVVIDDDGFTALENRMKTIPELIKPDMRGVKKALMELASARTEEELKVAKAAVDTAMKRQKAEDDAFKKAQERARESDRNAAEFINAYEKDKEEAAKKAAKAELEANRDAMKKLHDERMKQLDKEKERVQKQINSAKAKGFDNLMATAGGGYYDNGTLDQGNEERERRQRVIGAQRAVDAEMKLREKMLKTGATLDDPTKLGRMSNLERAAFERLKLKETEQKAAKIQKEKDAREKKISEDLDAINKKLKEVGL